MRPLSPAYSREFDIFFSALRVSDDMSDQGSRAKAIFLDALEQEPPEAVAAFLDSACAGDQSLRLRVEELLKAHRDAGSFLGGSPMTGSRTEEADFERPGTSLGPYKLLEQIGEGGFGVVFMAEQQQPVRRTVALKVIKPGMDSRQVIARFEAERQALALMDHPNIAKVFDAGVDSGKPYFVMELVKGIPITEYCDRHQLTPRDRLTLFISVCQAVQHAHQKGIVHRDLKPTNVLVAAYDGLPIPKVIDFGIAKALGQPLTEKTLVTGFAGIIGTLEYMSPEQAEFNARDIDTRADIYSLGVLLYELLTGTTPIPKEKFKQAAINESLRLIREEEPPKPSSRLSESKERLASISAQRMLEPARLTKEVQGELDWIVMKALEKDRSRRYETANGFLRDIQRYLNEEPVEACPPSTTYRLRKFARRNRKVLSTMVAFFLLMMLATLVSTWLAIRMIQAEQAMGRERDHAVSEKARAEEQAAVAKAVNEFLQNDLLAQASADAQAGPGRRPDPNLKVRTLLDRASDSILHQFDTQPIVEANIRNTMGVAYSGLGQYQQAEKHFARARELYLREVGPEDARGLRATNNLANAFLGQRRPDEACKLFEEVVQISRRVFGPDHADTLGPMNNLANVLSRLGRWDEARKLHEETLEARRRVLGPEDRATLQSMNNLADVLRTLGQFGQSRKLQEEALEGQRRVLGAEHPQTLGSMYNLALLLALEGKLEESFRLQEQVLETRRRALGPNHPDTIASLNELAWRLATAPPKHRNPQRALQLAKEIVQLTPDRADAWNTVGVAYYRANDWKNAIAALEKSEKLAPGELVAANGFFLAMSYQQLGEKGKAQEWYGKAVEWMDKRLPKDPELLQFRAEASQVLGVPDKKAPAN
jgi:eukaryotic-like serine/threonine-protein kinase